MVCRMTVSWDRVKAEIATIANIVTSALVIAQSVQITHLSNSWFLALLVIWGISNIAWIYYAIKTGALDLYIQNSGVLGTSILCLLLRLSLH